MPKKTPSTSSSSRSPNLTDKRIEEIAQLLDGWSGKLTWEILIARVEKSFGSRYTRQALDRHARVKMAYQAAKEKTGATLDGAKPKGLSEAEKRRRLDHYETLQAEVERLKRENETLLWQFVRWEYNALQNGLSKRVLDAPLPDPDRNQSVSKDGRSASVLQRES